MEDFDRWRELGQQLRADAVRASSAAGSGHPTSSMSAADLAAVLLAGHFRYDYDNPKSPANDRLIFSKGHASPLVYGLFRAAGAISEEEFMTYRQFGSRLEGHPTPVLPWVDVATGSLGQGLPIGVGLALAGKKLDRLPFRTWVICGDSELAEGSIWEAADAAGFEGLDNLTAIVDGNRLGQRGQTRWGWDLDVYARRFEAFGWHAIQVDGHDVEAIHHGVLRGGGDRGAADGDRRAHEEGPRLLEDRGPARLAREGELARGRGGGAPRARRRAQRPDRGAEAVRRAAPVRGRRRRVAAVRAGLQGRDAEGVRRGARRPRRGRPARRRARRRGRQLDLLRVLRQGAPRAVLRDVHRRAADGRRRRGDADPRLEAVRGHVRGVPVAGLRLRPHVRGLAGDDQALRLARRRVDRRGRPLADGARGHRVAAGAHVLDGALPVRRQPDHRARPGHGRPGRDLVPAHDAGGHDGALRAGRGVPRRRLDAPCARATTSR